MPTRSSRTPPKSGAAQRRAERALYETEAKLRAVLDTAVDAIVTIDDRGLMLSVNPSTERLFGFSAGEMLGQNVSMLMPSPYCEEHDSYLARYLKTGEKRIIGIGREVRARRKDGTIFPVDLAVSEVERGKLFTGIIRDISERKLAEARARENDRLASIGTLAAGLGHDMNNVLLPVRAHINALKAEMAGADGSVRHVERIQKGVDYLQQLADGLHYLAMDPEQVDDSAGATNLAQWWSQTGALLSKAAPKHVHVEAALPADLPDVSVAAHALTQAALNLIVNAGEAIPADRVGEPGCVRVWAKAAEDGATVQLGVTDNGTGMTDEVKRRAFELFFTTKPRGMGTGLGLALVRKVVDHAGGSVQMETTPGRGTSVVMLLPVVRGGASGGVLRAVVTIADGRAASFVAGLVGAAGAEVALEREAGSADLWIVEPGAARLREAQRWRDDHPHGRLVLFGNPAAKDRKAWNALDAMVIEDRDDISAIRIVLGEAILGS